MPYKEISDLPDPVKKKLPQHAAKIYLSAFNNAWQEYKADERREEIAHRVAWAAVKKQYEKDAAGKWVRRKD